MKAKLLTKRYFTCPRCHNHEFYVEHLMAKEMVGRGFGPWYCDKCNAMITGTILPKGAVSIEVKDSDHSRVLSLLKLGDIYIVVSSGIGDKDGKIQDHWDFFYHSHQCPTNLFHNTVQIFDNKDSDPHGVMRFVSYIPETEQSREMIHNIASTNELFEIFKTDGNPLPSEWPEENKGVLDWIVKLRRGELVI